ncbi:hypothetical protein EPO04_00380 [Patescibacteria group bacterium]|nr:MAG: hypothetical protein EPO04_00380 [Patescibacteria group bacterium]
MDGVAGRIYFAYEQLRNAAEYGEQHLLLRRSIERFLQRSLNFNHPEKLALELVIELTQARYLKNDSVPREVLKQIDETIAGFCEVYKHTLAGGHRERATVRIWVLQSASVYIEQLISPQPRTRAFVDFAFQHYLESIEGTDIRQGLSDQQYEIAVYCATHRAIMKSDIATARAYAAASRIAADTKQGDMEYFVTINSYIDELFNGKETNRIMRMIGQYGAPMRILREMVVPNPQAESLLHDRPSLIGRSRATLQEQYSLTRSRLNNGIVRSVAFVAITKILIGLVLEIPYDLIRHGAIVWPPLIMNVLFPPLYMATLGLSIRPPSQKNSEIVVGYIDRILYQTGRSPIKYRLRRRVSSAALNRTFNLLYGVVVVSWVVILTWILAQLGFNLMSGIIFFVFLSTVSFLGFRLTQTAREFEMIEGRRSFFGLLSDFFYTPFIRIGHWLSDRYARVNVVARILDILIEMPLKFGLRFLREWMGFLRDKQEEL